MEMYHNTVQNASGNVVNGATITVYEKVGGAVATIYDKDGVSQTNPFLSGLSRSEGEIEFAAANGMYDIKIVSGAETDWIYSVALNDTRDLVVYSISALEAVEPSADGQLAVLTDTLRHGHFVWDSSNLSTEVSADSLQGIYVAPSSDPTGASGAWVRQHDGAVDPKWFGATGDGVTDDSAAIQEGVDYVQGLSGGGTLLFDGGGTYLIGTQIDVDGVNPITIAGDFGAPKFNAASTAVESGFIGPKSGILSTAFLFKVSAYNPASRNKAAAVYFNGLTFSDSITQDGSGDWRGDNAIAGAIFMETADSSSITDCSFNYINGSAIKTERFLQSEIRNNHIRFCGRTGFSAVLFAGNTSPSIAQSVSIAGNKIESNYDEDYVSVTDCQALKIIDNGFEANSNSPTDATAQCFINIDSLTEKTIISGNSFNKNGNSAIITAGGQTIVSDNTISGDFDTSTVNAVVEFSSAASRSVFSNNAAFCGTSQTGVGLLCAAANVNITDNVFQRFGAVSLTGIGIQFTGNICYNSDTTANYYVTSTGARCNISGNLIDTMNNTGTTNITGTGGVDSSGQDSIICNNVIDSYYRKGIISTGAYTDISGNNLDDGAGANADGIVSSAGFQAIIGNDVSKVSGVKITQNNASTLIKMNRGYATEQSGAAVVLNGTSSITVTHNLAATPNKLLITAAGAGGGYTRAGVSSIGATTFDIVTDVNVTADTTFYWEAGRKDAYQ